MADKKGSTSEKTLYCSFCGKSQHEVKKLIAGPSVFICDECIDLCNEIIRDELPSTEAGREARGDLPTPSEISFQPRLVVAIDTSVSMLPLVPTQIAVADALKASALT